MEEMTITPTVISATNISPYITVKHLQESEMEKILPVLQHT
jgi:hypothetical protein